VVVVKEYVAFSKPLFMTPRFFEEMWDLPRFYAFSVTALRALRLLRGGFISTFRVADLHMDRLKGATPWPKLN
jgi:hypothetical protein